jgi:hypothetical protein
MKHTTAKNIRLAYEQYQKSNATQLYHVYGTFSANKQRAIEYCFNLAAQYGAFGRGRILSHNSMVFSYGFIGEYENRPAFFYITRDYDRYIFIDELNGGF